MNGWRRTAAVVVVAALAAFARADETVDDAVHRRDAAWLEAARRSREALEWTDEAVRHDWRLQRRPGTTTCRILDPADGLVRDGTAWHAAEPVKAG